MCTFHKLLLWCLIPLLGLNLVSAQDSQIEIHHLTVWQEQSGLFIHRMEVQGDRLYAAVPQKGLAIYDISDPLQPKHLNTFTGSQFIELGSVWDLAVTNNLVYITDTSHGIAFLDVTNPTNIVNKFASLSTPSPPQGICLQGNRLYVADGEAGLLIVDVSVPAPGAVNIIGQYNTSGSALEVQVVGNTAYVADGEGGLQIIDVSDSTQPKLKGNLSRIGNLFSVAIAGNYAFTVGSSSSMHVIDVSNPEAPKSVAIYRLPFANNFGQAYQINVINDIAYIACGFDDFVALDVSVPKQPNLISQHSWYHSGAVLTFSLENNQLWLG